MTKYEVKMAVYWPSSFFAFLWTEIKVFRFSFSEAIPIFFNRLKSDFFLVRSL